MRWVYNTASGDEKNLGELVPRQREVIAFLDKRIQGTADPRVHGQPLRHSKHGLWRYRVRNFRVICRLEDTVLTVLVVAVGLRSTVYDR